jgi:hypothetical protein
MATSRRVSKIAQTSWKMRVEMHDCGCSEEYGAMWTTLRH